MTDKSLIDPAASPLNEAEPQSLEELMERDPLEYSKQDIAFIVNKLRAARKQWADEEAKAAKSGKRMPAAKVAKQLGLAPEVKLEDLNIKI